MLVLGLLETDATVTACLGSWLVKVDEDLWVSEGTTTSVTSRPPCIYQSNGILVNHGHGAQWVWLQANVGLLEARTAHRVLLWVLSRRPDGRVV